MDLRRQLVVDRAVVRMDPEVVVRQDPRVIRRRRHLVVDRLLSNQVRSTGLGLVLRQIIREMPRQAVRQMERHSTLPRLPFSRRRLPLEEPRKRLRVHSTLPRRLRKRLRVDGTLRRHLRLLSNRRRRRLLVVGLPLALVMDLIQ